MTVTKFDHISSKRSSSIRSSFNAEKGLKDIDDAENESKLMDSRMVVLFFAMVLSNFIAAVDETIVSTAMGAIVNDFKALDQVTWIAVSYLLTVTAIQPIYGKLSDVFGSKITMAAALTIFAVGSILCGAAKNIIMFIVFRAFSGIGGGGLITMPFIIISDIVPLHRRGLFIGILEATYGLSQLLGPIIGGSFADYVSWRWAFYINVPICAFCFIATFISLGKPKATTKIQPGVVSHNNIKDTSTWKEKFKRIDYGGAITLMIATTCLVLGTHWGGSEYEWTSAPVLTTLILAFVFTVMFIIIEFKLAAEPIAPYHVFNRNTILVNIISIVFGGILYIALYYFPLYYQVIQGKSSTLAGVEILPFLIGVVLMLLISGVIIHKTGRYRWLLVVGSLLMTVGIGLMILIRDTFTRPEMICYPLIAGTGIGMCIGSALIAAQAAVDPKDNSIITALANFSITLGGIIGLVISGAVFNNTLERQIQSISGVDAAKVLNSNDYIKSLTPELATLVKGGYINSFRYLYMASTAYAAFGFLCSLGLKHIPVKDH